MTNSTTDKCPPAGIEFHMEIRARFRTADLLKITPTSLAREYRCSIPTLFRRLQAMDTNYQHELNLERWRRFCAELSFGPILSGPNYLEMLGFREPRSFYVWFQKQTGRRFADIRAEINLAHQEQIREIGEPVFLNIIAQPLDEVPHETIH